MSKQEYYTIQELIELNLNSLPSTVLGIRKKANRENWQSRPRQGKGGGLEYSFESFNQDIQQAIILKIAKANKERTVCTAESKSFALLPQWERFEKANNTQKDKAKLKFQACVALDDQVKAGLNLMQAIDDTAKAFNVSHGSLKNWYYKVRKFERSDWLAILLCKSGSNRKINYAEIDVEAWEVLLADYLRPERPSFSACYYRLTRSAKEMGWTIPAKPALERKLKREVQKEVQVFLRDGERALFDLYPAMRRSVEDLQAMEWINGDGYQHNVFVKWKNGEIVRPKTWLWQDVRTRKILAWRCDLSENSDTIRLSLMDLINKYGIPKDCTIDNTRAAANKWLTGGVKNRYRFKVKEDDPVGIIPLLGITLHWTSVIAGKGHGQAKPIERAFSHGGLGEVVDKHPSLAGYFAGENVYNKPDNYNYGKDGVDFDVFITALEQGIQQWNERPQRKGEITQGLFSYSDVFARDYALAKVRKATDEQIRQLMLMSEAVTINKKGEFKLEAGGKLFGRTNVYWSQKLISSEFKKVVVRFDPEKLHENVEVYTLDGRYICTAECSITAGFGDKSVAREHSKHRKQFTKAVKQQAKAMDLMEAQETAAYLPETTEEDVPQPSIIELYQTQGSVALKQQVVIEEDEEISEFEKAFQLGVDKTNKLKLKR
ncbi:MULTISPECIES: transposase domain-containing protein [Pasteurellaceae]|uniref:Transposase domain-containing protein n=1 Tax=Pasteurella atlantica TaxID=2827233 RepID=A0AAW8CQ58_9PAST|nr:transposase domain-containing protein [Pasteurella atlantica]MBR0573711.1 Mu transposase C-terminal domain-containing protein [Pasteurella atlantica]MDP8039654.1 transposase domain-containing protein [Pasteurella atlantica]MDP8041745.1 transposase domain-containing protein [Pasteurella atlantica]MDP8043981.1 transposase domain-containing protein [Pasteurella atlantica]MDP8045959.1 transposase domain-containing protein [Pasteurella atlantica]